MRAAFVLLVVALAARGALAADKTPAVSAAKPTAAAGAAKPAKPGKGAVGVRQQGDDFTDPGSQPGDDYVDPDVVKQVFTSASPPTEEPISQEFICSVFGGPSCPDEQPINVPCLCEDGEGGCQCVPYYQCDKSTGSVNQFGVGVIDIRQGNSSCPHYIYKCCKPSSPVKSPPETPYPGGSGSPDTYPGGSGSPDTYPGSSGSPDTYPGSSGSPDTYPGSSGGSGSPDTYPGSSGSPDPYPGGSGSPDDQYGSHQPSGQMPPTDSTPDYNTGSGNNNQPDFNPQPGNGLPPSPPGRARCGQRNPEGIGVRITGDEDGEAQFGEFPWMVAVLKVETSDDDKKRNLYQCGGALITPKVVLTAAHCVKNRISAEQLKVRAGEWDTQTSKEMYRHQDVSVDEVVVHPDYYAGAVHNDVALLFLSDAVHIGYHIGTICMPEQDQNFDYNKCFVSGWGKDKFGQQGRYQVILKKLELPIVPHEQCQEQLRRTRLGNYFVLHHSFICAGGEEGKDTCKGDGGSPLVCPMPGEPGRYQLAGTVAWGIDCGLPGVPGVYGNVPLFRNWVDEQLRAHNIDDSPYLP